MLFIVEYIAFYCWYVRFHSVVICHLPFGTQPFASCLNIIRVVRHRYWHIPYSLPLTHSCISLSLSLTRVFCYFAHILIPIAIFFTCIVLATKHTCTCIYFTSSIILYKCIFDCKPTSYERFDTQHSVYLRESPYLPCWPRKLTIFFLSIPAHAVYFFFIREIPYHWKHR